MPPIRRRTHFTCAFADPPAPKPKAPRKLKRGMTSEEKEDAEVEKLVKKAQRERKKEWEATLVPATQSPTFYWPEGTKGMFPSDAKRVFKLTPKEMETLKREHIQQSPKCIVRLSDIINLAKRKHEILEMNLPPFQEPFLGFDLVHTRRDGGPRRTKPTWGILSSSYRRGW